MQKGEIQIFKTEKGTDIQVRLDKDTVWLTQSQLIMLFERDQSVISRDINNVFKTKELDKKQTCAKFAQVQKEGNKKVARNIMHYNLDAILSVGYGVNSKRGTQFRQWATQRLKDYLVQGYAIQSKKVRAIAAGVK